LNTSFIDPVLNAPESVSVNVSISYYLGSCCECAYLTSHLSTQGNENTFLCLLDSKKLPVACKNASEDF